MSQLFEEYADDLRQPNALPGSNAQNKLLRLMMSSLQEEFHRPLNLIYNNCECLKMQLENTAPEELTEKMMVGLDQITNETMYVTRLIDHFAEMNASMQGALVPAMQLLDLVEMIKGVCADSAEIYRALGITLVVDETKVQRALVVADRTFAERICLNLLSNALHACTEGQTVVFAVQETSTGYGLTVTDDGYGFPARKLLEAFEPLQGHDGVRYKGFERGGGMGLYLCSEYCRLMGWKIAIAPLPKGTRVSLDIPRNENVYAKTVRYYDKMFSDDMQFKKTRMEVMRALHAVRGLEKLRW